jgi:hypothetical protein
MWEMKSKVSVVRLIVATRSSGPPVSGKIIKEMPGSVASGTPYRINKLCIKLVIDTSLHYDCRSEKHQIT